MALAPLADWANFYVITGSSAGGLTGLTFVVIALAAEARRVNATGLHTFITPTIVHFGTVLALAAFLCVPRQTTLSVAIGIGFAGLAGLIYIAVIFWNLGHGMGKYEPFVSDWVWNVVLPGIAYGGLFGAGLLMRQSPEVALYVVSATSLMLLFIGIHNAWDIAVWMSLRNAQEAQGQDSKGDELAPASRRD
jgi:hypothetical protein